MTKRSNEASGQPKTKGYQPVAARADLLDGKPLEKRLVGLKGMSWAYVVLCRLNVSPYKAGAMFAENQYSGDSTSSRFYQYLNGKRAPDQVVADSSKYDIVREVERVLRSTEATDWLEHPLWEIFSPTVTPDQLAEHLEDVEEEADDGVWVQRLPSDPPAAAKRKPFRGSGALLAQYPPEDLTELAGTDQEPRIESFDDFIYLCAMFRLSILNDYWLGYWQVMYLLDRAAELNDIFGYVKEPFAKMLQDFYGEPEWFGWVAKR